MRRLAPASRTSFGEGTGPAHPAPAMLLLAALGLAAAFLLVRAGSAAAVPPGFGIEKVSPGAFAKNDADVPIQVGAVRAAADGSRVTWMEYLATPGDEGGTFPGQALATLGANGWSTRGITPPVGPDEASTSFYTITVGYLDFAADLSKGALVQAGPALVPGAAEEQGMRNAYIRDLSGNGGYSLLTPPPVGGLTLKDTLFGYGTILYSPTIADSTPDMSHVVFETSFLPLVEGAVGGNGGPSGFGVPNVYEWDEGQVKLVSVMPNGEPAPEGAVAGAGMKAGVNGAPICRQPGDRVISRDGRNIVFTVPVAGASGFGCAELGAIYVRVDGTSTQYASRSQRSTPDPAGTQPAYYVTSSADGRYVFLASTEKLTDDSAATTENDRYDLYRYDTETEELQDLTSSLPADSGSFQGLVGASNDGRTIYFGFGPRVFVWSDGSLAPVTGSIAGDLTFPINNYALAPQNSQKRSVVSADGRWAVLS